MYWVRTRDPMSSTTQPKGAIGLTADELRGYWANCGRRILPDHDLFDPITLLIATGMRRSELPRRAGKFRRRRPHTDSYRQARQGTGEGLQRDRRDQDGRPVRGRISLPGFAVDVLPERGRPCRILGERHPVIFPSTAGTLRDPNNCGKQWHTLGSDVPACRR